MTGERKAASKADPVRRVELIDSLANTRRKVWTIELALCGLSELSSSSQCDDVRSVAAEADRELAELIHGLTTSKTRLARKMLPWPEGALMSDTSRRSLLAGLTVGPIAPAPALPAIPGPNPDADLFGMVDRWHAHAIELDPARELMFRKQEHCPYPEAIRRSD